MICPECGRNISWFSIRCPYCNAIQEKTIERNERNWRIAGAFCLVALAIMAFACLLSMAH